jgi:hypothetical protein
MATWRGTEAAMKLVLRIVAATALVVIAFGVLDLIGIANYTPAFHQAILHNLQATIRVPADVAHSSQPQPEAPSRPCQITTADGRVFDCAHSLATGKPMNLTASQNKQTQ